MQLVDEQARMQLDSILGSTDDARMDEICNWPDAVEDQTEWEWAAPLHYVNIPRSAASYDAERDCPNGLCLTEAIKKYAAELANAQLPNERREQAFGWLCHLVGDMHQPLHCGFADDRGGNTVEVIFAGERINLHEFWDRQLILSKAGSLPGLLVQAEPGLERIHENQWNPAEVNAWTTESHGLAGSMAYPATPEISDTFEEESWLLVRQRLPIGAMRLARILNATLGEGKVILDRQGPGS
jgi:nuclease S1